MKRFLFGLWIFLAMFLLSACRIDLGEEEARVEAVSVLEGSLKDVYTVEDFDPESLRIEVLYSDDERKVRPFSEEMLSASSLALLQEAGAHTLSAVFEGQDFDFDVRLVEEAREVFLYRLYMIGVVDNALDEDYESWKESLRGEPGIGVSEASVEEGMLTLTLSDGSVLEAGMVEGEDGREVELRTHEGFIEWRYENEDNWETLLEKDALRGEDGREIELRSDDKTLEWRYASEDWQLLMDMEELPIFSQPLVEDVFVNEEGALEILFTDGSSEAFPMSAPTHTVVFLDHEGRLIALENVEEGEKVAKPSPPDIEGYAFEAWSTSTESVYEDMVVTAQYSPKSYTVSYQTNISANLSDETYLYGETIEYPVLEKEGLLFAGWYVDTEYSRLFNHETMPARDLTLYARWYEIDGDAVEKPASIEDILDVYRKSVIGIEVTRENNGGRGSGVVYKYEDGRYYAFTNYHVVKDSKTISIVYEHYGNAFSVEEENLELLGTDARNDIALLRFESAHDFEPFSFSDSYEARIGEDVYAIGSPLGFDYYGSVTQGIVSNLTRFMTLDETNAPFIQHDAAINPGNSGGALINASGEILGMNTLKMVGEDVEGMGYALPSNTIVRLLEDIEESGHVTRGALGVTMQHIGHCDYDYGVCVEAVEEGLTADILGIEPGDVIVGFKTDAMTEYLNVYSQKNLREFILNTRALENVSIQYVREGDLYESAYEPLQIHPDDE